MTYRDMSVPYTEEEIQGLREIFQSLPTYKDGQILVTDFPDLIKAMRYERTPEQVQTYIKYWQEKHDGKIKIDEFITSATSIYKTSLFARDYAIKADKAKNGFISANEFKSILEMVSTHDPNLVGKSYEDFVAEEENKKDGKVDINKCTHWIEQYTDK